MYSIYVLILCKSRSVLNRKNKIKIFYTLPKVKVKPPEKEEKKSESETARGNYCL